MAPGKLLLFGEHTILHGGEALALPLRRFGALWSEQTDENSAALFKAWAAFAKTRPAIVEALDVERWDGEVETLAIKSNIPEAYGLGSSGALTALIYQRYKVSTCEALTISQLRTLLGELESYFHGRSSGLDPLVSTLNAAVHVTADGQARRVDTTLPHLTPVGRWFLLDSQRPKAGEAAIRGFGESCQKLNFRSDYLDPALILTESLIASTIDVQSRNTDAQLGYCLTQLKTLSELQLLHLSWLVPKDIGGLWADWLQRDLAYLKLCGAGGGGYFLGYALDKSKMPVDLLWL